MTPTDYAIIAGVAALSVGSLLLLSHEKKKYGTGLAAKTAHTASRYRLLWLLVYATAIPTALTIHLTHLATWFYTGIGRLILATIRKTVYTSVGFTLWIIITSIRLGRHIGNSLWKWVA